ncbi:MAG: hypothetical protein ACLRSW_04525 [Christensenellaceae bacterium]
MEEFDVRPKFLPAKVVFPVGIKDAVAMAAEQSDLPIPYIQLTLGIKTMIMNFITKPDFVSYCCYNLPYHRAKKKENRAVLTWTIRTQAGRTACPWVDNVIFENFRPGKTTN